MIRVECSDAWEGIRAAVVCSGGYDPGMRLLVSQGFMLEACKKMVATRMPPIAAQLMEMEKRLNGTDCDMILGGVPARLARTEVGPNEAYLSIEGMTIATIIAKLESA